MGRAIVRLNIVRLNIVRLNIQRAGRAALPDDGRMPEHVHVGDLSREHGERFRLHARLLDDLDCDALCGTREAIV